MSKNAFLVNINGQELDYRIKQAHNRVDDVIRVAEVVANLGVKLQPDGDFHQTNYLDFFLTKVRRWFEAVPRTVVRRYEVDELFNVVTLNANRLQKKTRHGDFAPWHIFLLDDGKLGLIDGEHASGEGVEYYDVAYLIQRVWQVLKDEALAKRIYQRLIERGYDVDKLRTVLVARAIGGFLDESLANKDYARAEAFKRWVSSLRI